jgi:hypothetical protein
MWGVVKQGENGGNFLTCPHERNTHFLVGPLGMDGIVMESEDLSNLIQESGSLTFAGRGLSILLKK